MTFYIGVDFHPHQQTVAWCDGETGETGGMKLAHEIEKVREYYTMIQGPAVIGVEASARAAWFERMVLEAGHKLLVGNPVLIRKTALSRHKNDRIDAEHILWLLMRDEFPAIWRRPPESNEVLEVLRLRWNLVRQRTQVYNRLQALAHNVGMPKVAMRTIAAQQVLKGVEMNESGTLCREHLFSLLSHLNERITDLEAWLKPKAAADDVQLLMTQKGVGYLSALTFIHTVGDITRFRRGPRSVTKFAGYDSLERTSADKKRFGHISKAGPSLLRFQLGQAAQNAIRLGDANLKAFYRRLLKKKPKAVAKTATARRLLVKLSIMLRDKITAQEFDLRGRTVGNARNTPGLQ